MLLKIITRLGCSNKRKYFVKVSTLFLTELQQQQQKNTNRVPMFFHDYWEIYK